MANYPIAAEHPDLDTAAYIPILYAAKLLVEFYKATVFGVIANTDYEGMIKDMGSEVKIRLLPEIVINDYVKGQNLNYDNPEPSSISLLIDKGKYFALSINEVDRKQVDIEFVSQWARHGSSELKPKVDYDVLSNIYGDAHASNKGASAGVESGDINLGVSGTPLQATTSNILDIIVNCGVVLDEQNVPEEGRWMVLPAWACGLIKRSDLKDASLAGDGTSILRNGRVGMVDRFTIYMSNNIAKTTDGSDTVFNAIFGHKVGLTFASQIVKEETLKNPNDFGDLLRALHVYGYKVVKSKAIGHLYIKK